MTPTDDQIPALPNGSQADSIGLPLTQLVPGQTGTVCGSTLNPGDRRLLRAMGLRERVKIELCRLGEPCIVRVMGGCNCSSRIGLARPVADRLFVQPDAINDGPDG